MELENISCQCSDTLAGHIQSIPSRLLVNIWHAVWVIVSAFCSNENTLIAFHFQGGQEGATS